MTESKKLKRIPAHDLAARAIGIIGLVIEVVFHGNIALVFLGLGVMLVGVAVLLVGNHLARTRKYDTQDDSRSN